MSKSNYESSSEHRFNAKTAVAAIGLLALGGGLVAHHSGEHNKADEDRIAVNQSTILKANTILTDIELPAASRWRSKPSVENGSNESYDVDSDTNVGKVGKGKVLEIPYAIVLSDGWIAFEEPGSTSSSLDDQAKHLVYANPELINRQIGGVEGIEGKPIGVTVKHEGDVISVHSSTDALGGELDGASDPFASILRDVNK